jgi:hypothetical protein
MGKERGEFLTTNGHRFGDVPSVLNLKLVVSVSRQESISNEP